jgi:parallel beta-helix repeat protein
VDGFTIRNGGNGIAMYGGVSAFCNNAISANTKNGVYAHGGTATVSNNTVTGNAADGVYVLGVATLTNNVISQNGTGVYVDEMSDVTLTGNSISQNSKIGVYIGNFAKGTLIGNTVAHNSGTGVSADSFSTATLTGNNVSTNEGDGVRFEGAAAALAYNIVSGNGQDGVDSSGTMTLADNTICGNGQDGVYSYQEAHLTNNTIVGNGQAGVNTSGLATFMNNIVATNGGFGLHNTGVVSAFSHNDVFGNASGAYYKFTPAADQGNVSVDPMLSNIYHDVHLQPGSPCIDAGDDSAVTPGQTDVYGKPRIIGAHVDIGADESDGTAWTVPSRVWFVSPAGSDSADGQTWGTAKKTVIGALSVCQGGDEVWVANGTYRETVEIPCSVGLYGGFVGNETDRGARNASANPTVFDGGGGSIDVVTARFFNTVVDGFTIRNGENGVNVISGLAMVTNDLVSGNIEDGVCVNDGTAMVINSTLTSNAGNGVEVLSGAATLANDTITGNCGTGVANYSNASLSNTIIAFNRGEGVYTDSSVTMPVYSHNDVYGNTTGNYQGYTPPANMGNISVDPMLSSVYHDIHLQPGSPCINTGDDSVVTPGQTDFYGKPRIIGAHVDIGADESDGTVWTVPSRVWYVSPAGSDLADGLTWSTAKGTVNGALFASQGGDEVWVAKGTYVETVRIPNGVGLYGGFGGSEADRSERNAITNPTVLDGGGGSANVVALVFSNNIVDSFTLRNGGYGVYLRTGTHTISNDTISGNSFGGVIANYGTLTLTNNTVSGNAGSGIVVQRGSTASLTNNTVFSNTGAGVSVAGSATLDRNSICGNSSYGVYIGYNALLTRNIICRNTLHGVFVYSATATLKDNTILSNSKCGVDLVVSSATVANNTISDNGSDGISDSNISAVTNNVVVFNGGYGVHRGAGSFVTYSHNDVYGNTAGQYSNYLPPANMANISADPLFADRASSDYHLLVGSPCIDAGDDSVLTSGETDIEGNPRKQKAHVDIGAYEFPAPGCYTLADVTLALRIAAGLSVLDGPGLARLNVATDGGSASVVDVSDAVSLIRKVAGPEPNP